MTFGGLSIFIKGDCMQNHLHPLDLNDEALLGELGFGPLIYPTAEVMLIIPNHVIVK